MRSMVSGLGIAAVLVALTGCGGDDGSSAQSGADGEPIVIFNITDRLPGVDYIYEGMEASAQAAVDYVNEEKGGVDGRKLELISCDSKNDPGATTKCAQDAVRSDAVAEIGLAQLFGPSASSLLARAGLPTMAIPNTPQSQQDENSFALMGGGFSVFNALSSYVSRELGAEKVSVMAPDIPTGREFAARMQSSLEAGGTDDIKLVYYSLTSPDVTPAVQRAIAGDTDGSRYIVTSAPLTVLRALSKAGFPMDHVLAEGGGALDYEHVLGPGGDALKGLIMTSDPLPWTETSDPDVKLYLDAMEKYAPDVDPRTQLEMLNFANVMTLYDIFREIGGDEVSRESVKEFVDSGVAIEPFLFHRLNSKDEGYYAPGVRNVATRLVQWDGKSELEDLVGDWYIAPDLPVQK